MLSIASTTTATANGSSSFTINAPSGIDEGDLLVLVAGANKTTTITSSGFTVAITSANPRGGSDGGAIHRVFYKVATLADESASNYTINFSSALGGAAVLMRISGWNGNTNNPIFNQSTGQVTLNTGSNTDVESSLSFTRPNDGLFFITGIHGVDDSFVDGGWSASTYSITSTDGNLTWTERIDAQYTASGDFSFLAVATAPSTDTSNVTAFNYQVSRGSSFTQYPCWVGYSVFSILEPRNETGSNTLLLTEPVFFINATSLGATGTATFFEAEPVSIDNDSRAINTSSWTNKIKPNTTWTNTPKL